MSNKLPWENWSYWQDNMAKMWKEHLPVTAEKNEEVADRQDPDIWQEWFGKQEELLKSWMGARPATMSDFSSEKMLNQFSGVWQEWVKSQEKMWSLWKDVLDQGTQSEKKSDNLSGNLNNYYRQWMNTSMEAFKKNISLMPNQEARDTYAKLLQSASVYSQLLLFWNDYVVQAKDLSNKMGMMDNWKNEYGKILQSFFSSFFPEQLQVFFKSNVTELDKYKNMLLSQFKPWLEYSPQLKEKFNQLVNGDRESYTEFLKVWQREFEKSFGSLPFSDLIITGDHFDKMGNTLDQYLKYSETIGKFFSTLHKVGYDSMEKLIDEYRDMQINEQNPEMFKQFYQKWGKTNEQAYLELFKTEEFAKMLGEIIKVQAEMKKQVDGMIMEFVRPLPLATKQEMDNLYKTVHDLKQQLKKQSKIIEELKEGGV